MVETPLRRSRRIQTQSDDESSIASSATPSVSSRRTRSSSIASNNSMSSATRRSTRVKVKQNDHQLDAIPEKGGDNETKTPIKSSSTKKKKKKIKDTTATTTPEEQSIETKDPTPPPKSSTSKKKKRKKSIDAAEDNISSTNKVESTPKSKSAKSLKIVSTTKDSSTTTSNKKAPNTPESSKSTKGGNKTSPKKSRGTPKSSSKQSSSPKRKHTGSPKLVKPVMNTKVHRLRFLKLHQKSILSMASTPIQSKSSSSSDDNVNRSVQRLAISREGGSVELVCPQDRWTSVGIVPGIRKREVDALVWVCGNGGEHTANIEALSSSSLGSQKSHHIKLADEQRYLYGCSRDGTIFELDFATQRQTGVIGSGGGGVFCLVSIGGYFAAGCEDGTIKIYSVFDSDGEKNVSPQLVATLPSAGNAILSLAWAPGQGGDEMGGSVMYAGVADGTIRRFDCATTIRQGPISTGSVLIPSRGSTSLSYRWRSTLRMTVENRGLREPTKVWALKALSDGTLISGDSLGHVQVWDGTAGTMTQTFDHNESGADVLCLAVSEDENKIFASGIDSSVRCIQRQCSPPSSDATQNVILDSTPVRKWISSNSHRKHSHDVKALAICHKKTAGNSAEPLELLVSGSVDTRVCTYIVKDFKSSRPKIWYNWPTQSPISVSCKQRLLAVTRSNRIDLYRLSDPEMADRNRNQMNMLISEPRDDSKSLVKSIAIQSHFNLSCSVISNDGKYLAASDAVSLYVFSLEVEDEDGVFDILPTKLHLNSDCKQPATALRFDDKGKLICATNNGPINILKISNDDKISLEHAFKEHMVDWSASSHHFPVVSLDLSSDGKWLAAGRFSSGKGAVHVFTLPANADDNDDDDNDGCYKHWWSIPEMDASTTCVKFLGGGSVESSLAVGCSNNEFYIYNLGRRSLSHWSNDMGLPLLKSLPMELTARSEPVARIVANPASPQRFILVSMSCFVFVS